MRRTGKFAIAAVMLAIGVSGAGLALAQDNEQQGDGMMGGMHGNMMGMMGQMHEMMEKCSAMMDDMDQRQQSEEKA